MKVGSKGHYGLLALAELVESYKAGIPMQVKEIAKRQQIPQEYLGQIMVLLKRSNLVHGARGPGGGYLLARPGVDVRSFRNGRLYSNVSQKIIETWATGVRALEKVLEETTLADLCKTEGQAYTYYI
jgi:DNA-binding IscR family transcriptional regulator